MPRIVVACALVVGGCSFSADYSGATVYCSDGKCPSGLECRTDLPATPECREPRRDAAVADVDAPGDTADARLYGRTCNDPQPIVAPSAPVMDTTASRSNSVSAICNSSNMLGFDAVYRLDNVAAGKMVNINLGAAWTGAAAYIIQPCQASNITCVGNVYAQNNAPVNVTILANGPPYVVVDSTLSGTNGPYTLTITVTN